MSKPYEKYKENVPGRFFVDAQCIDCDICVEAAPANFRCKDGGDYSYVYRQPTTLAELGQCVEAKRMCPVDAIGEDTTDAVILDKPNPKLAEATSGPAPDQFTVRATVHEAFGSFLVHDNSLKRMLCLCTKEQDAHLIAGLINDVTRAPLTSKCCEAEIVINYDSGRGYYQCSACKKELKTVTTFIYEQPTV